MFSSHKETKFPEIEKIISNYFQGYLKAEPETLLKAFHEDARLFSTEEGKLDKTEMSDWIKNLRERKETLGDLFGYTQKALDALGIRWGAAHTEIMLTKNGPRLIESSPRMIGGPVVGFAREATGSSQADKLVEIYVDGDVRAKEFVFKKTVVPVFLKALTSGTASNIEALDSVSHLPTLLYKYVWIKNGDRVTLTVDYLTSIGIIALAGDRESIFLDYKKIRAMESKLVFTP